MPHDVTLLTTIAAGLGLAFAFGLLAARLRLPPILGYLIAGVIVGPFTPGYVADSGLASQLAELGIILLMFGVGLHFSISDLLAVRRIAIPGAVVQITVATGVGALVSRLWGWPFGTGIVFGLSLSVASTVVLLRALEERGILQSVDGRIAVGWLIVQDLVTVLALVKSPTDCTPPFRSRVPLLTERRWFTSKVLVAPATSLSVLSGQRVLLAKFRGPEGSDQIEFFILKIEVIPVGARK